ncbi:MAG: hypothetical protein EBX59_06510, partial [Betaproteobacteria bacterium]|nr:hypothetical protein [Betaproteobacteria bacterium]
FDHVDRSKLRNASVLKDSSAEDMAKAMGATVIVTVGNDEKCKACLALGADYAINYKTQDFEAEVAIIVDDVPMQCSQSEASGHIRLLMLANDWSLRHLVPDELAKGFGFYQSKPATAFAPLAVTPDELGAAWDGERMHLPVRSYRNETLVGQPQAGEDMVFGFPQLIEHAAKTRRLRAGSIIGSGTVSNRDRSRGYSCIAEIRALEIMDQGLPNTAYLHFGERIRIEVLDARSENVFGTLDQQVLQNHP